MRTLEEGTMPFAKVAMCVRFGACEFETAIPATRSKLAADLEKSIGRRRRSETFFREEHAADARAALAEVALAGGGTKLCQPGDMQALLDFLDASPKGFLVMASALTAIGSAVPVG
jgi:hypothetical protein